MSDDSFIREVDEDLRNDQFKQIWANYKWLIIGIAASIIVVTAGSTFWKSYTEQVAGASGDRFVEAVELSSEGKHDEAIAALEKLAEDGAGEYPALAQIRLAAEYALQGDQGKAVEAFDSIAGDSSYNEVLRNVARLRAGLVLVDTGTYEEVAERLETMAGTGMPFRHSAREGLGLSAWKHSRYQEAFDWFNAVSQDVQSPQGIRSRAGLMLELLAGKGVTAETQS